MIKKTKILIVGASSALLLALIVVPNVLPPRMVISQNSCINILRQIDAAKYQWMTDNHKTTNDTPRWEDLSPYFHKQKVPLICPNEGIYTIGKVGELPICSIAYHTEYWKTHYP